MKNQTIFCVGDIKAKRMAFKEQRGDGRINLDNDEVIATYTTTGGTYFVVGSIPFADMTVAEYVAYHKSLVREMPVRDRETKYYLKLFGAEFRAYAKMKSLSVLDYRIVQLTAAYDLSVSNLYINLDGLQYSRKNKTKLNKMLQILKKYFTIFIAVTDYRFIERTDTVVKYNADGTTNAVSLGMYFSKKASKKEFIESYKNSGIKLNKVTVKRVINAKPVKQ